MTSCNRYLLIAGTVLPLCVATAHAQATAPVKEESPGLMAKARVAPDSARAIALHNIPDGTIMSAEIEVEGGKLMYSFDISRPGKPGIDEVQVDARTGAILGVEHETPAAERAEAKKERTKPTTPHR